MERFVADERTGLKYELVGDYYLIAGDDESETPSPWITPLQTMWVMKGYTLTVYAAAVGSYTVWEQFRSSLRDSSAHWAKQTPATWGRGEYS